MKLAHGTASKIQSVPSHRDGSGTVLLEVGGTPVTLQIPTGLMIQEGESIVVAGRARRGSIAAFAFHNASTGVSWRLPIGPYVVASTVLLILGLALLPIGTGVIAMLPAAACVHRAARSAKAFAMVTRSL